MTKKKLSVIELIVSAIAVMFLFIPGIYIWNCTYFDLGGKTVKTNISLYDEIFNYADNTCFLILALIVFCSIIAYAFFLVFYLFKQPRFMEKKSFVVFPFLNIVFLVVSAIVETVWNGGHFHYEGAFAWYDLGIVFFVELLLLISIFIIACYRLFSTISYSSDKSKSKSVDDLKKFKELLDMGIITQEEFDAKKKELLGL